MPRKKSDSQRRLVKLQWLRNNTELAEEDWADIARIVDKKIHRRSDEIEIKVQSLDVQVVSKLAGLPKLLIILATNAKGGIRKKIIFGFGLPSICLMSLYIWHGYRQEVTAPSAFTALIVLALMATGIYIERRTESALKKL